jgi:hypothetical protein
MKADRPQMPQGYGVPGTDEGMLPWSFVIERLAGATSYWVATCRPDGRPHVMPVWGSWTGETLYLETSRRSRKGRNLAGNPAVAVHLESADELVVIEGTAHPARDIPAVLFDEIASDFEAKYQYRPTPPGDLYAVTPEIVFAWSAFPNTATRWRFD